MVVIETTLDFLADRAIYNTERPYFVYPSADSAWSPEDPSLRNIEWTPTPVTIHDVRGNDDLGLDISGFEMVNHESSYVKNWNIDHITEYTLETRDFLTQHLGAKEVIVYDFTVRKNVDLRYDIWDAYDKKLVHGPPRGIHVDLTFDTAKEAISGILEQRGKSHLLQPGLRYRLINTWRPLLPKIEDRPLAFCDYRSIDVKDIVTGEKVYPHWLQELYYLKYNSRQKWYWISQQKASELLLMKQFDSKSGKQAKYCPHISFENPAAEQNAPPRESVETRSLIISEN